MLWDPDLNIPTFLDLAHNCLVRDMEGIHMPDESCGQGSAGRYDFAI